MKINHNLPAMSAQRQMNTSFLNTSKSSAKIAAGLRITRASDDAAGLAISEKMRAQIRGLNMAARNTQDAISLLQVAEGALNEVHSLLQRGRELAVQGATDTNADFDRQSLNNESNEILKEITRISNNTEFNSIKLFAERNSFKDPSKMSLEERIVYGLKSGWIEESERMIQMVYGISPSNRSVSVVLETGSPGDTLAFVSTGWSVTGDRANISNMELHIELSDFDPSIGENGENTLTAGGSGMYNDRIIAHEMVHAIMADAMGDDFYDMPTWFKEGTAEFIHGADERLKADVAAAGGNIQTIVNRAVGLINGNAWAGNSADYSASYLAVKYIASQLGGNSFSDIIASINDDDDTTENTIGGIIANTSFTNQADLTNSLQANGSNFYTAQIKIDVGAETDTGSAVGSEYGFSPKSASDVVPTGTYKDKPSGFNFIFPFDTSNSIDFNSLMHFQIGANTNQTIALALSDVSAKALGLNNTDLSTRGSASDAITRYNNAILTVSTQRSNYGAVQNRLEHTLKNLENTSENLQSAESRIRDLDLAREMMNFTKNNILLQSTQAMLSQANQQPQAILQLLRA